MLQLTSGAPFWLVDNGLPPHFPVLDHDTTADVVVLGAGISGALVADALTRAGLEVVILDKHYPGTGSTSASTALLQFEVDTMLTELRERYQDTARADRCYQAVYRAYRHLVEEIIPGLPGDLHFQQTTSLYLGTKPREATDLRAEARARQEIGLPSEFLTGAEVQARFGIDRPCAIYSTEAAQIDALRLTMALHQRALAGGARLFERTEIVGYDADATGVTLTTSHNFRVRARHVVCCTGYETPLWAPGIKVDLRSSFAIVTEPLPATDHWPTGCHIWETARPYAYCRLSPDGRVIAGGVDIPFKDAPARDALLQRRTDLLLRNLRKLLPRVPWRVDFRWGGTFAETPDGLPYVSQHPDFPQAWFALGAGGNGIVFATLAAQLICAALTEGGHTDLELFRFDRPGL